MAFCGRGGHWGFKELPLPWVSRGHWEVIAAEGNPEPHASLCPTAQAMHLCEGEGLLAGMVSTGSWGHGRRREICHRVPSAQAGRECGQIISSQLCTHGLCDHGFHSSTPTPPQPWASFFSGIGMRAFQISHCRSSLQVRTWPLLIHLFSPRCPQSSLSSLPKFSSTFPLGGPAPLPGPRYQRPPPSLTGAISPKLQSLGPAASGMGLLCLGT